MFEPIEEEELGGTMNKNGLAPAAPGPEPDLRCKTQLAKLETLAQNLELLEQNWSAFLTDPEQFNKNGKTAETEDGKKKRPLYIGNVPQSELHSQVESQSIPINHGSGITRNFACTKCHHRLSDILSLKSHLWANHNSLLEIILCPSCGKSFDSVPQMNEHYKSTHGSICQICSATFESLNLLKTHMAKEHGINQSWKCSLCPEKDEMIFFFNQEYMDHKKIHQCTLVRSNKSTGGFVTSSYRGEDPNPQPPDFYERPPKPILPNPNWKGASGAQNFITASYKCPECPKVFTSMDGVVQHRGCKHGTGPMGFRKGGPGARPALPKSYYGQKLELSDANTAPLPKNSRYFSQPQPRHQRQSGPRFGQGGNSFGATPSMMRLLGQYQTQASYTDYNSYSTSYQHLQGQSSQTPTATGITRDEFFNYFDPTPGGKTSTTSNSTNLIYNPLVEPRSDYYDAHPVFNRDNKPKPPTATAVGFPFPPPLPPPSTVGTTTPTIAGYTTTGDYDYGYQYL